MGLFVRKANPAADFQNHSATLAYVLAVLSSLVLCSLFYAGFQYEKQTILTHTESELKTIADLKAGQVSTWLEERKADVIAQTAYTVLVDRLVTWLNAGSPQDDEHIPWMNLRMSTVAGTYRFDALQVLDREGNVRLSSSASVEPVDEKFRQFSLRAMASQVMQWYDLILDTSGKPMMGIIMPLRGDGGKGEVVGALFARIDPAVYLYPLIQSWPVPSETAEILLVRGEGDQVLYLNELRHRKSTALVMSLPLSAPDVLTMHLVKTVNGWGRGKDYRGQEVIGYSQQIPGTNWIMVAKIDEKEVHQPVHQIAIALTGGVLILLFLSIAALWNYLRSRNYAEKHFQEKLKRQALAQQYQFLSKYANDMIFLMRQDGRILDANDRAVEQYGYTLEEMRQMGVEDFLAGEAQGNFVHDWQKLRDNESLIFEAEHRRKDESLMQVEASVRMVKAAGEEYAQCILRDITARKSAETQLRRLFTAVEQSPVSIFITDGSGNVEYVNPKFTSVTGYSPAEIVGKNPRVLQSGSHSPAEYKDFWATIASGRVWQGEFHNRRKNGELYWEQSIVSPIVDQAGSITGFVALKEDITEKKAIDRAFRSVSRLYQVLGDINAEIVRAVDEDALFSEVCHIIVESDLFQMAWVGMLDRASGTVNAVAQCGDSGDYLAGLKINIHESEGGLEPTAAAIREGRYVAVNDIQHDPTAAAWQDKALQQGYRASVVFPLRKSGQPVGAISLYASDARVLSEDVLQLLDGLEYNISYALDSLAGKRLQALAEQQVRTLNADLERRVAERTQQLDQANKELEAFSYSVSHDLRAPLRSIDGFSSALLNTYSGQLDAKGQDYLERVRRASQRMGDLIDDLLYLSRVTRSEICREPVDLSQMALQIVNELKESAPERVVKFIIAEDVRVNVDAKLMRIVLENLLGNAWKFTARRPQARIELGQVEQSGIAVIFVRDNGAGFNMDYAHKLFNPFQRLHGMHDFEGTGIGLATVHRIIERFGGRVWAEAKEGEGAAFYFTVQKSQKEIRDGREKANIAG